MSGCGCWPLLVKVAVATIQSGFPWTFARRHESRSHGAGRCKTNDPAAVRPSVVWIENRPASEAGFPGQGQSGKG